MDSSQMPPPMPNTGLHQINSHQLNSQYSQPQMQTHHPRISTPPDHDELIPTAIVIKNIPFAVKKESLVALMTEMNLPLPYAFNYHFDNGVFRGLAFANFTTPEETSTVIDAMNHMDLQGRKLRVEYKKMLPAHERERIERDKRERRGQLEEQHRPIGNASAPPLHSQTSMNSLHSNHIPASPSPVQLRGKGGDYHAGNPGPTGSIAGVDMNDPSTLGYFTELTVFKTDSNREILVFPSTVSPHDRKIIHTLAHNMGLEHRSEGAGDSRCVQIFKTRQSTISPAVPSIPQTFYNNERRGLNRAATIDFAERRENEAGYYPHTLGRQGSGLLDIPASPGLGLSAAHNLRAAKSFADLRSYTPSPAQSVASYPTNPSQNIARYTDYGHSSAASGTPNLTPTSAGGQMNDRNDAFLVNGLNSMTIGFDRPAGRSNGRIGQERDNHPSNAGPIGSHRPVNGNNYDESSRNGTSAVPERQPRGPVSEWGSGFSRPRQNGHRNQGSGELDLNSIERDWDDNRVQDSSDRNTNGRYH
jgi:RNA recognition motif-containing protein